MKYSQDGISLTKGFETCPLKAYQKIVGGKLDVPTIAYGHTRGVVMGMTCTQAQADAWLVEDIAWAEAEVNKQIHVPLTQGEFDALVDFTFNCGAGNFDHSTLLSLVNNGNMSAAALEFDKWDHSGGQVVAGLLRRREVETQTFNS